jgi:hypothetical protein
MKRSGRRELTDEEKAAAARLLAIWEKKKKSLCLTQVKAAEYMKFDSYTTVNHYLHGRLPLNTNTLIKFAKLLNVSVLEISVRRFVEVLSQ